MSKRWNNQTQDWETDVVETKEELVAPETVELPPEELPPLETVVELPPVVDTPEEFGNVELVEIPIEVVNDPRWYEVIGNVINNYPLTVGVMGVVLIVVVWQLLKK
jgi:hypothetical protein